MNKRYQVFISSTYSDLKDERSKVMQTIMSMDCIPAGMELFPAIDDEQFEFIKKVIDDCDYYVLIIGGRYGSISEDGISYTEKEFDYAVSKGIPVISFLHNDINKLSFENSEKDSSLREKLSNFRTKASTGRLVKFWSSADELNGQVAISLMQTIKTHPAIGWVRANLQTNVESLSELNELRKELAILQEYKAKTEKNTEVISVENCAGLDEEITITFERTSRADTTATYTWGELFGLIAPFFIKAQSDEYANRTIIEALGKNAYYYKINLQDYQTIKLQFRALGLFSIKYTDTTKGDKALFWFLTDKGNRLMNEMRVVKTQKL